MDRAQQNTANGLQVARDFIEVAEAAREFVDFLREFRNVELDTSKAGPWFAFVVSDPDTCALLQGTCRRLCYAVDEIFPARDGPPPQPS